MGIWFTLSGCAPPIWWSGLEHLPGRAAMLTPILRRTIFFCLILTFVAVTGLSAATANQRGPVRFMQAEELTLPVAFDGFWSFLVRMATQDGCHIDPNGRCAPTQEPQQKDGCHIDPDGRCRLP